jgi:hypothetical protein
MRRRLRNVELAVMAAAMTAMVARTGRRRGCVLNALPVDPNREDVSDAWVSRDLVAASRSGGEAKAADTRQEPKNR